MIDLKKTGAGLARLAAIGLVLFAAACGSTRDDEEELTRIRPSPATPDPVRTESPATDLRSAARPARRVGSAGGSAPPRRA